MQCNICEIKCNIPQGKTGKCNLYRNDNGWIVECFPNRYLITCPITIETMPILHFYPGKKFLQISTIGCNFNCEGCISTVIVKEMTHTSKALRELSPIEIIDIALKNECEGIVFLMNDPLASFQTFLGVAKEAKGRGLYVGCSSNTYFTESSLNEISKYLDFINVGIKGISDKVYINCGGKSSEPVFRNIKMLYEKGIHIEVSCIYKKGNENEVMRIAELIGNISKDIPLQIMRFIPLENADPLLEPSIRNSESLCILLKKYVKYVYLFNSPGSEYLNTYCPNCNTILYKRDFYGPMGAKLKSSQNTRYCFSCGTPIAIKSDCNNNKENFIEEGFQGGYPFTRALEIVESILITMGVCDKEKLVHVWEKILSSKSLNNLHHSIQKPGEYVDTIRYFGKISNEGKKAEELAVYIEGKLGFINKEVYKIHTRPRVYYAMGKPLFHIKGERLENQLVETAGGISVNKEINCEGRPGISVTVDMINQLNPEIMFISAFLSSSIEDFYMDCIEKGIHAKAVENKKIYLHPSPGWDFGSPRWILGLMYMANIFHPDIFNFDIQKEADIFYRRFYNKPFILSEINRSFSKPDNKWGWDKNIFG